MKFFLLPKKIRGLFSAFALVLTLSNCLYSQSNLTADKWREDLTFLRQVIETKYSNLFYNVTKEQFESAADALYSSIPNMTENEIRVGFFKLVAMFRIGHTHFALGSRHGDELVPVFNHIPVRFYFYSDGVYISRISAKYKDALGGKVLKIGGMNIDEVLLKMHEVISAENEQYFKNNIQYYLCIPEILHALKITGSDDNVSVTYEKDKEESEVTLETEKGPLNFGNYELDVPAGWVDAFGDINKSSSVLWMKEPAKFRYYEYMPDTKILYIRHSLVLDAPGETIKQFFDGVFEFADSHEVDKFILDIRLNGGGNNYLNKPIITGIIRARNINRYGHLFVITGKATFSAAQNLTNGLEKYTEAIFVGEPTAENINFYGDTREETLPNSMLRVRLSWLWWQDLDPRDKRQWKAPQLAALMSFNDYKSGVDPSMNVIMNFHDETPAIDRINSFIESGKYDEAEQIAKEYIKDPVHSYFKAQLEDPINILGYSYMEKNDFEKANKVFYINMKIYPESANTYDSYAESFLKMGKKDEALKYYQMASEKDAGAGGENARKMIEEIKNSK